jgi:hypothetical protein
VDLTCSQIETIEKENLSDEIMDFDMDMVLDQLEDYGKYKGVLEHEDGGEYENYIPVSMAKRIVRGRGLGGVLGYLEENDEVVCNR